MLTDARAFVDVHIDKCQESLNHSTNKCHCNELFIEQVYIYIYGLGLMMADQSISQIKFLNFSNCFKVLFRDSVYVLCVFFFLFNLNRSRFHVVFTF